MEDLATLEGYPTGVPYEIRFGSCASGHSKLEWEEALENSGRSTYDSDDMLVYRHNGGYISGFDVRGYSGPRVGCDDPGLGSYQIGPSDPASDCTYCSITRFDPDGYLSDPPLPPCEMDESGGSLR